MSLFTIHKKAQLQSQAQRDKAINEAFDEIFRRTQNYLQHLKREASNHIPYGYSLGLDRYTITIKGSSAEAQDSPEKPSHAAAKLTAIVEKYNTVGALFKILDTEEQLRQQAIRKQVQALNQSRRTTQSLEDENRIAPTCKKDRLHQFYAEFEKSKPALSQHRDSLTVKFILGVATVLTGIVPMLLILAIHSKHSSKNSWAFWRSHGGHLGMRVNDSFDTVKKRGIALDAESATQSISQAG